MSTRVITHRSAPLFARGTAARSASQTTRQRIPDEYIVAFRGTDANASLRLPAQIPVDEQERLMSVPQPDGTVVNWYRVKSSSDLEQALAANPNVESVSPNYAYEGDPREGRTAAVHPERREADSRDVARQAADPQLGDQYHHRVMRNQDAWEVTQGSSRIVVAVMDDGVDLDHEDLRANLWRNEREVAGNGIDDDSNGFVDDVNGWDFTDEDSSARPATGDSHGTHVAGIVGATKDNGVGVSGTAPGVRIMPARWIGGRLPWSTAVIVKSLAYAVDNGARILNSSYNIDGWVGDRSIEQALDYVNSRGAIFFNSAGNAGADNSARTRLKTPILVGSSIADNTENTDKKSSFSNFGTLVDIFAPGGGGAAGILSTVPGNRYERMAGTSMASPNAAASAALIWSAHPDWNREQVLAQMFATADDITAKNPTLARKLGAGRVNNARALTERAHAPRLDLYRDGTNIVVRFPNIFAPSTVNARGVWTLVNEDTGEVTSLTAADTYGVNTNQLLFSIADLRPGRYRFVASSRVLADPFGRALDGDGDGAAGDDAELSFVKDAITVTAA